MRKRRERRFSALATSRMSSRLQKPGRTPCLSREFFDNKNPQNAWLCTFCGYKIGKKQYSSERAKLHLSSDPDHCQGKVKPCNCAPESVRKRFTAVLNDARKSNQKRKVSQVVNLVEEEKEKQSEATTFVQSSIEASFKPKIHSARLDLAMFLGGLSILSNSGT